MSPLPERFNEGGFSFRLVKRTGRVAMLSKTKERLPASLEVVIIQTRPAESIRGREYPAREVMPRSEQWGVSAWTPFDREEAEQLFERLASREGRFSREGIA